MNRISARIAKNSVLRSTAFRISGIVGVAALLGASLVACKQRGFNSRTKSATSASTTTVLDKNFPADYNVDKLVYIGVQASYSTPGSDLTPTGALDGKGNPVRESFFPMFTPWLYFIKYVRGSDRTVKVPRPLPKAYLVQLMNKMRDDWHEYSPNRTSPITQPQVDLSGLKLPDSISQKDQMLVHGTYDGDGGGGYADYAQCVGNTAPHWSDLQLHWYCQLPYAVRNCYSTGIRAAVDFTASEINAGKTPTYAYDTQREVIMQMCTGKAKFDPSIQQPDYSIEMFNAFYDTMWVPSDSADPASEKVNVFDYIMRAQTYSNDPQEEQDILNEYYGAWKPKDASGNSTFNAADNADCRKYRPKRGIENYFQADEVGDLDYCKVGKLFTTPHASLGR